MLDTDLTGKVCVITGAGGAICGMFAEKLAAAGGKVAVLDLNEEAAQKVADKITAEGGTAKAYKANVLDRENLDQVHEQIDPGRSWPVRRADQWCGWKQSARYDGQ